MSFEDIHSSKPVFGSVKVGIRNFFGNYFPHVLLALAIPIWIYSGVNAFYPMVWLAEAIWIFIGLGVLVWYYARLRFSKYSYALIFIFFVLTQIGSLYSYSHVPYNDFLMGLTGFDLNKYMGTSRNHFDRLVHFCSGLLLFLPVLELLRHNKLLNGNHFFERFFSFLIISAFCAFWELYEWMGVWVVPIDSYWLFLGVQDDVFDAQKDMAFGVLGAVLAWLAHALWTRRYRKPVTATVVAFMLLSANGFSQNIDATALVKMATEKIEGKTLVSEVTMQVIRPGWQNEIKMKSWAKENRLALILITAPARDKGQAYLKRDHELWNWLPGIEKTVKLSSTLLSQSWMGSDFNNEDLINKSSFLNDYHHTFLMMEDVNGSLCYKLELRPIEDAPVVWGKVHLWVSKAGTDQLRALFFDENNQLVRTMNAFDIRTFGNKTTPSRIEMQPADKPRQKTVMIIENYEFNRPLDDDFFSQQNMRRIK